jgi:MATE family multidrug resistance protein
LTARIAEPAGARTLRHLGALGRLAWPVMLSRAGILLMALVDVVMLARFDTLALAQASVALGLFVPIMVTGVGLQMGVISLVARRHGAGRAADCVDVWLRALPWACLSGTVGAAAMAFGGPLLRAIGQPEALAQGGGAVALALAPGVLLQILYVTCAFYLEGTGRPKPALAAMAIANLLNVGLNWVLIYGNLGAPALGAVGSALATTAVRLFLAVALMIWILRLPEVRAAGGLRRMGGVWGPGGWAAGADMRRLGYAAGLSVFFETSALGALAQMAGLLGPTAAAAYAIAANAEATVFMVALGLGVAAGVRVGAAAGAGRPDEAAFAGWTGLGACVAVMGAAGLALAANGGAVAGLYSADPAVAAQAAGLMAVVAVMVAPDGGQIVMGQCNRALGDGYVASALYFASFWLVAVPLAAALAFGAGLGAAGLMWGACAGAVSSVALQGGRFLALTRQRAAGH